MTRSNSRCTAVSQKENSRIRPAEAPAFDPQRHPESTVAHSQPLITVAQSISRVKIAQCMTEPARGCLLSSYRTYTGQAPSSASFTSDLVPNLLLTPPPRLQKECKETERGATLHNHECGLKVLVYAAGRWRVATRS